jgi:hypothetical protein
VSEVAKIFQVFFWSGVVVLLCWLAVMLMQALPSFREAAHRRPGEEVDLTAEPTPAVETHSSPH